MTAVMPTTGEWTAAAGAILAGLLAGWILSRVVSARLRRLANLTTMGVEGILAAAVRPVIAAWFLTAGAFVAKLVLTEHLVPRVESVIDAVLITLLVGSATIAVARMSADFVKLYALRTRGIRKSSSLLVALAKIAVYTIGLLVLVQSLGVRITPLLGALGVGGIAVALALQPTLSNFFSGIHLLASGTIRPGDFVEFEGKDGFVEDINWRYTTIRQLSNNLTVVPNAVLSDTLFTNYSLPSDDMSLVIPCRVAYGSDLGYVERVAIEVATEAMHALPGGAPPVEPFVRFNAFAPDAIAFDVILRVREFVDQYLLKHEFVKRLDARFRAEGIEIPLPRRVIQLDTPENDSRYEVHFEHASPGPDLRSR